MAFPAVTNVDGSNPGPQASNLPDTVQAPVGNLWKVGTFAIALTPAALGAGPSIGEQTFVGTAATARRRASLPGSEPGCSSSTALAARSQRLARPRSPVRRFQVG